MLMPAYMYPIYFQDVLYLTKFLEDLVIPWVYMYVIHHYIVDLEIFIVKLFSWFVWTMNTKVLQFLIMYFMWDGVFFNTRK